VVAGTAAFGLILAASVGTAWVCALASGAVAAMQSSRTIEQRMQDLVVTFGDVPPGARKLEDYEARQHQDIWIQRLVGEGITCNYVVGYQLNDRWWTFCFDRREDAPEDRNSELWVVEAYDSDGGSWRRTFQYSPTLEKWTRAPTEPLPEGTHPGARAWT
jgi:hypothetical protein